MQQTDEMKQAVFRQEYEKTYGPMRAAGKDISPELHAPP